MAGRKISSIDKEGGMRDRRVFERIPVQFSAKLTNPIGGSESQAEITDVSATGICLESKDRFTKGESLDLWLNIPDRHEPLYTHGEVVWIEPPENAAASLRIGVRLERPELMGIARVLWLQSQA
jgi:Tfp pilus assembly protein PilZ